MKSIKDLVEAHKLEDGSIDFEKAEAEQNISRKGAKKIKEKQDTWF